MFQDAWSAKLPWAKFFVDVNGKVHQVRCKVCNKIEQKEKILAPKLDSLSKHGGSLLLQDHP